MKILYGDAPITMLDSVFITIVSMSIVFFVLILISSILSLFKYISSEEGAAKKSVRNVERESGIPETEDSGKRIGPEDIKDEKMLAAVTVAVIEAAGETENAYIRVKSIKELT